jgi:HK97 family phage major capsid protein
MASVADLAARRDEILAEIKDIDAEHVGQAFSDEAKARWNELNSELDQVTETIGELKARADRLTDLADDPKHTEGEKTYTSARGKRVVSHVPDDPTQIEQYRTMTSSMSDLEQAYRDGAMKIVEGMRPSHPEISTEQAQDNVARMLDTIDLGKGEDGGTRALSRRIIATSSRAYSKEFGRYLSSGGQIVGPEMQRAASLTTTAGGFAVPVVLDPTVILTSSGVINPIRQIARVERTVGNTLEFISSTGITAGYGAEAVEASDNAPTLAQPTLNVEKAFAFVPFSIEIGEDWAGIQASMAMMFSDAKDTLENTKFLTGLGHASNEPSGLIAVGGATAVISSATTAVFAVADLYSLETALAPRWRARASIVGNRAAFQKVRQFDTAGGANLWVQLQNNNPATLLGYNAYEWSAYSAAVTTTGSTILTIGDFNQFLIADRVGMNVELIPHLFGSGSRFPTGQRGLYMYWRNSSKVLTPGLSANSAFQSLKLL